MIDGLTYGYVHQSISLPLHPSALIHSASNIFPIRKPHDFSGQKIGPTDSGLDQKKKKRAILGPACTADYYVNVNCASQSIPYHYKLTVLGQYLFAHGKKTTQWQRK